MPDALATATAEAKAYVINSLLAQARNLDKAQIKNIRLKHMIAQRRKVIVMRLELILGL